MATTSKLLSDSWIQSRKADLLQSLKNLKPLQHLSADDIMSIVRTAEFHAFNLGDLLCQQGQSGSTFFCVEHGSVSILKDGKNIATVNAVDYVGLQALQYQRPRSASVVAATSPCIVCELTPSAHHIPIIVETVSSRDESASSSHQPRRSVVGLHQSPSLTAIENSAQLQTVTDRLQMLRNKLGTSARKSIHSDKQRRSMSYVNGSGASIDFPDNAGEPGSRPATTDSLSQLVDTFTLGPSSQSASRAVVAPDGLNPLPQPLSSTANRISTQLETEQNFETERNRRLQSMEHSLEQRRQLVEDVDALQAYTHGPLPALPASHAERHIDTRAPAPEITSEDQPPGQLRTNFSDLTANASETLSKDGSSPAPDVSLNAQHILTSHVRHAPAAARREDVLVQELQAFDAALVKTFPNISASAVNIIIQNATRRLGTLGCEIFREGEVSSDMMFLFSGRLDVRKRGQSKVATIDCSSVVGHHSYLYHRPRSATVVVGNGPQCIYYNFSIDECSNDVDVKSGLWHNSTARLISSKSSKENESHNAAAPSSADLITADEDIQQSPLSKRRMSALLGDERSMRRYTRDVLDYEDSPLNAAYANSVSISPFEYDNQSPSESRSGLAAQHSPRQRLASAVEVHSSRRSTSSASPVRPASSRSKPSLTSSSISPSVYVHDVTERLSPRPAAAASRAARSSPASSSPNRRLSIITRTKQAVQEQLSSSSSGAVSCILFSAAWLLCLTQLEKLRMPEPRHAVCRQLAVLAVSDNEAIKYMCARLRVVPAASKASVSKSVASSSQSPDKGLSMGHTNSSTGLHRSLSRDAGLPPEVFALLPEPSLIVEILSEVVLHQGVSRESSGTIMSIMATLLHRSVRHAVASNFLRVWSRFLSQEDTEDEFVILSTDCIVTLACDTSLGSATFITDSCGAVGIIEILCAGIAARLDSESAVCTAMLRCLQMLVHHHVANQGRLCACGGLAAVTQFIVNCNAARRSSDSVEWAVAIVAHVASSSRAGFDAAMSCGGVDAVFMAGALCSDHTQAAIASAIFDMVCSGPQVAALVRHQCDIEDASHIQTFSLLLRSGHPDIRRTAHTIVTRIGSKVDDRSLVQPKANDRMRGPAQRWK